MKKGEQIERVTDAYFASLEKPWRIVRHSHKKDKSYKLRAERRRARRDPETIPLYRKYDGYEW